MFAKELDGIAGFAATEAFESSPGGVDYKAGSFFVVERATSGIVDPLFLQGDEITQDIAYLYCIFYFFCIRYHFDFSGYFRMTFILE
jgi:hypothetical protein